MMKLLPITKAIVKDMLSDEELFNRYCEDGLTFDSYTVPDGIYLGIFKDDTLIGFWAIDMETSSTINIHCNVLKRYREHSNEVGGNFADYIFTTHKNIHKLNAKIAVIYPDVYNYTKKFGMKDEGIDRASFIKNGSLHDRHIVGLTREDYENV